MSSGSRVELIAVTESTRGATPAAGTWETVRYTDEGLVATPETELSNRVRADRNRADSAVLSLDPVGNIDGEYDASSWDEFLESVFYNTWSTNVLKNGTAEKSFSIQKDFSDLATLRYINFRGCIADSVQIEIPAQATATLSWQLMGTGVDVPSSTSAVGTGSVNAAGSNRRFVGTDFTLDEIDTVAPPGTLIITGVSLNLSNGLQKIAGLGSVAPREHSTSPFTVTGTLTAYLDSTSMAWYTDTLNQTTKQLKWTLSDGTNSHEWEIPSCKFGAPTPSGPGVDGFVEMAAEFTAFYDATEQASVVLTRA